jgi:hypothetical protein
VIGPILRLTPASADLFAPPLEGKPFHNPAYADMLTRLAEGEPPRCRIRATPGRCHARLRRTRHS